jgi:hypothetical protein
MDALEILDVDPLLLRLPPSRRFGADPVKFQRQVARHGKSIIGMPRLIVLRATDGELVIYDGVTRATRVAKFLPGQKVTVEVIDLLGFPGAKLPTVGERLP